jgi:protein-S-isoprenylcysteine O-methyltransferase Ste14
MSAIHSPERESPADKASIGDGADRSAGARPPSRPRILLRLLTFVLILAGILFLAAGRWDYWLGWIYMGTYACITVAGLLAVPFDPDLVAERTTVRKGVKAWDRRLTVAGSVLYPLAILVVAGLDARFGWSPRLGLALPLAALGVAVAGNLLSIWATAVNRFYSRFVRIQVDRGHHVVSAGPYRAVRHPGYLGQILFSLGSAVALGSLWALIPAGLFALLLVVRTALEDRTLQDELEGYAAYARRVRHRLVPYLW